MYQPVLRETSLWIVTKVCVLTFKELKHLLVHLFSSSLLCVYIHAGIPMDVYYGIHTEVRELLHCSLLPGRSEDNPKSLAASTFTHRDISVAPFFELLRVFISTLAPTGSESSNVTAYKLGLHKSRQAFLRKMYT